MNLKDNQFGATLPKRWVDDFTIALRAREVPGAAIGDAIKSVEDYWAQSGETPEEAFGAPGDYAAALELPTDPTVDSLKHTVIAAAPAAIGLLGLAVPPSIDSMQAGRPLTITVGVAVSAALIAVFAVVLWRWLEPLLTRRWLGMVVITVAFMATAFAASLLQQRLFDIPAMVGLVGGTIALVVSVVTSFLTWREDPIVDPSVPAGPRRRVSGAGVAAIVVFPVVVAVMALVAGLT